MKYSHLSPSDKDDNLQIQQITFAILASISACVLLLCCYNSYLILKNGRFKNVALALFYFFSFVTLLFLLIYFLDIVLNLDTCAFNVFMGFPPYTYVCTAYCYILNCTQLILKDERQDPVGNVKRRFWRRTLLFVIVFIIIVILAQFIYFVRETCIDPIGHKTFLNKTSILIMVSIYYFTFMLLMLNNWFLWRHIKQRRLTGNAQVEGRKHVLISSAFAISYLYRAIFNTIRGYSSVIDDLETNNIIAWCVIFFGLHFLGEFLPLTLLFSFQLKCNLRMMNLRQATSSSVLSQNKQDLILDFSGWDFETVNKHFDDKRQPLQQIKEEQETGDLIQQPSDSRSFENIDEHKLLNTSRNFGSENKYHPVLSDSAEIMNNSGDLTQQNNNPNDSSSMISIKHPDYINPQGGGLIIDSFQEMLVSERTPLDSEPAELVNSPVTLSREDGKSSQIYNKQGSLVDAIMTAALLKKEISQQYNKSTLNTPQVYEDQTRIQARSQSSLNLFKMEVEDTDLRTANNYQ